MTARDSLLKAMNLPDDSDTIRRISDSGVTLADVDTMSQAIHDVYCGITADHEHPNQKDRDQAQAMIDALQKRTAAPVA